MRGIRGFEPADVDPLRAVLTRSHALGGPDGVTLADHLSTLDGMVSEPERVAVAIEDRRPVGYVYLGSAMLEVDPPHRRSGHGRRLIEAGLRMAEVAGEDRLELWIPPDGPGRAFATALKMQYRASVHTLARLVGPGTLPSATLPEPFVGIPLPIDGSLDDAYIGLMERCFAAHPTPLHLSRAALERDRARPTFDPEGTELIIDPTEPGRPFAFWHAALEAEPSADGATRGSVRLIGVLPDRRGAGVGTRLLGRAVAYLHRRGATVAELIVDAANEDALRIYERDGFARVATWPRWFLPIGSRP